MGTPSRDTRERKLFAQSTQLPLPEWDEYWHHIFIDPTIKQRSLNYFRLMRSLERTSLSEMTLAQHRILLFYGPPGTGKTTFVRGLANRVAQEVKASGRLTWYTELQAHQLSSENLGGGPKLVADAFGSLLENAQSGALILCLIDEVESLLTNRALALNNANPVDVFRAVNEVFQQIDRLAKKKNVYLLATSNLPKAIDRAFLDRADVQFFVGLPNEKQRYEILADIFRSLDAADVPLRIEIPREQPKQGDWAKLIVETAELSGRHLRKLILEAALEREETAADLGTLKITDIIEAVSAYKQRLAQDREQGGVYQ